MKKIYFLLLTLAFPALNAQVNLTSSLVACYQLNGNAAEPINNLTGTLTGVSAGLDRFNNANSALTFTGSTSSMVLLPSSLLLKPNAISVSGWYKATQFNSRMTMLFAKNVYMSYHTGYGLAVEYVGNLIKFRAVRQDGSTTDFADSNTNPAVNTWYHVVFTMDANNTQLYVNGVLETSIINTINTFNYDYTKEVVLGGTNEMADNPVYFGLIDNLRFYSRVINASEVMALYNQDPPCVAQPAPVASFSTSALSVCKGKSVSLKDQSTNNPTSWNWSMAGGIPAISTSSNPMVTYPNAGTYTVTLVVSNATGTSSATQTISVSECTGLEYDASSSSTFLLYPNPVNTTLKIISESGVNIDHVRVMSVTGIIIIDKNKERTEETELDLGVLDAGIYLIEIASGKRKQIVKVIKS